MPATESHKYRLYSVEPIGPAKSMQKLLFSTNSQPAFARACAGVELLQSNTPKPNAGATMARAVVLRSIADTTKAYQAKASGLIAKIPPLRTQWPSVAACAFDLGINAPVVSQALYRARKENGGTDAPALVHGLCFAYAEDSGTNVAI